LKTKLLVFFIPLCMAQPQTLSPDLLKDAFTRPTMRLSQFEQLAIEANPTLEQAEAQVSLSAAQARQAGLPPNPSVGYEGAEIRGGSFGGGEQGAFIAQTFVLGGKLGLRRNVYKQQEREDELGVTEQRYRILSAVDQSFYSALAAQELVRVRHRLLELASDAAQTAHQLANIGQADAPDVLQAEVEAEQARVDYINAQRNYLEAFRTLAILCGKPELPVTPLEGDLEHPPVLDPDRILHQIMQNSPSIKRAQQAVVRAAAEVKSAERENIPDLQIQAGLQQNLEPLNGSSGKPVGLQGFAVAAITLPIFNRNQGNIAAAKAERTQAQAEVTRTQLALRKAAEPLIQDYLAHLEEVSRYKNDIIPRATRAYQLYLEKYHQMAAAYPQVIISQRTLFQFEMSYILALQQVWQDAVQLQNYALSGGLDTVKPF
jgi:cobalt-zinc-cadmium efflux system outer membrane protein